MYLYTGGTFSIKMKMGIRVSGYPGIRVSGYPGIRVSEVSWFRVSGSKNIRKRTALAKYRWKFHRLMLYYATEKVSLVGKPTTQSSDYGGAWPPSKAADGAIDGGFTHSRKLTSCVPRMPDVTLAVTWVISTAPSIDYCLILSCNF